MTHRSVLSNMLSFLGKIFEALDSDPNSERAFFCLDFCETFDRVRQYELIQKITQIRARGCLFEILINYLENRKQLVRIDNCSYRVLDVTSQVSQRSLLGPLLLCIFTHHLLKNLTFSEPFIFAHDLKVLSFKNSH